MPELSAGLLPKVKKSQAEQTTNKGTEDVK